MIEKTDNYKDFKRKLKKSNDYKQLTHLISSIILTETRLDYHYIKRAIPAFKEILCDSIDTAWNSSKMVIEGSLQEDQKHMRHITSVPKIKKQKSNENQLAYSSEAITQISRIKQERPLVSEFSRIKGPASFARSIREINKKRLPSPGPSCYFYEPLKQKPRSPRVLFPRSGAMRNSYIPVSLSPGPSKYYSALYPIVKHS